MGLTRNISIESLNVHVVDPVRVRVAKLDRVATSIDNVTGVKTQIDVCRVGGREDASDLIRRLDV